jgi:PAS domain-containing protein
MTILALPTEASPQSQVFLDERILDVPDRLFDLLPASVYVCDRDGLVVRYNRAAAELWGCSPKIGDQSVRYCGSYRLYRTNGDPVPHGKCPMADVLASGQGLPDQEIIVEQPGGTRIVALVNIEAIKDGSGKVIGAMNVFRAQPEQHSGQVRLNGYKPASDALLQGLPTAVYTTDAAGRITFYNQAAAELGGYVRNLAKANSAAHGSSMRQTALRCRTTSVRWPWPCGKSGPSEAWRPSLSGRMARAFRFMAYPTPLCQQVSLRAHWGAYEHPRTIKRD